MTDDELLKLLQPDGEELDDDALIRMLEGKTGIDNPDVEPERQNDMLSSEFQIPGGFEPEMQQAMTEEFGYNAEQKVEDQQQQEAMQQQEMARQDEMRAVEQRRLNDRGMFEKSGDVVSEINRTAWSLLGLPADMANLFEQIGSGGHKKGTAWPTSEVTRQWGADLGSNYADEDVPDTAGTQVGQFIGMGVETLVPILHVGKINAAKNLIRPAATVVKGKKYGPLSADAMVFGDKVPLMNRTAEVASNVAGKITDPFMLNPGKSWAADAAASAGSGFVAFEAGEAYGPTGEMIGGFAGGGLASLATAGSGMAADATKRAMLSAFDAGAKPKVRDYLKTVRESDDIPEKMDKNKIQTLPQAKLSVMKLTGDEHLLTLEREVSSSDPKVHSRIRQMQKETNQLIEEEMNKLGGSVRIEETQAYLKGRVDRLEYVLYERMKSAVNKAKSSLEPLSATDELSSASKVVRKQLEGAKTAFKLVETGKWSKVDTTTEVGTAETFAFYRKYLADNEKFVETSSDDIPKFVKDLLGQMKKIKNEDTGEKVNQYVRGEYGKEQLLMGMKKFRTRVYKQLDESTNSEEIYMLKKLHEALTLDMKAAKSVEAQEDIAASKTVHDLFEGDVMNTIFKLDKFGKQLNETLTLGTITTAGKTGTKAAVNITKILDASPGSYDQLGELVKLQLASSNVFEMVGGEVVRINLNTAQKYLKNNKDVLDIFPEIRDNLNFAIGQEQRLQWTKGNTKIRLENINKIAASRYSTKKTSDDAVLPGQVLPTILKSPYPEKEMAKVLSQSNKTGRRGIRRAVVDLIMDKTKLDADNMIAYWAKNEKVLSQAFNKYELMRLKRIINTADLNKGLRSGDDVRLNEILPPKSIVVTAVLNLIGLRAGHQVGRMTGATIHAPAKVMGYVRGFTNWLDSGRAKMVLLKSIEDPKLFKVLNKDIKNLTTHDINLLKSFQLSTMVESFEDNQLPEEQLEQPQ